MKRYSLDPNIIQSEMPQLETQEDFVQNFHPELLLVDRPKEIEEDSQYFSEQSSSDREKIRIYKFKHGQEIKNDLPKGYCLEGGTARGIVLRALGEKVMPPRDCDVVAISDFEPDTKFVDQISQQYMAQDNKYGYGVKISSLNDYFYTRDFTINEVLVDGEYAYISEQCLNDLMSKKIRPSEFERMKWMFEDGAKGLNPKLALKALRLQTEYNELYGESNIEGIAEWQWNFDRISLFSLALALDKCLQLGDKIAIRFYTKLVDLGLVSLGPDYFKPSGNNTLELVVDIRYKMVLNGTNPFNFSDAELNHLVTLIEEMADNEDEYTHYEDMATSYYGSADF